MKAKEASHPTRRQIASQTILPTLLARAEEVIE